MSTDWRSRSRFSSTVRRTMDLRSTGNQPSSRKVIMNKFVKRSLLGLAAVTVPAGAVVALPMAAGAAPVPAPFQVVNNCMKATGAAAQYPQYPNGCSFGFYDGERPIRRRSPIPRSRTLSPPSVRPLRRSLVAAPMRSRTTPGRSSSTTPRTLRVTPVRPLSVSCRARRQRTGSWRFFLMATGV